MQRGRRVSRFGSRELVDQAKSGELSLPAAERIVVAQMNERIRDLFKRLDDEP
jgi:hypothetical protein